MYNIHSSVYICSMSSGLTKNKYSQNGFGSAWGLPPQMVTASTKETRDWKMGCMDYFDGQSAKQNSEKIDDIKKCRIVSGEYNISDYRHISDPLTIKGQGDQQSNMPGMQTYDDIIHYPIMVRPINTIIGEYIKRISQLHGFYAKNESHYSRNQYIETKTSMLQSWATQQIMTAVMKRVQATGVKEGTEEYNQAVQQQTPEDIQDHMDRTYIDVAEQVTQILMKNIWKKESLDSEFVEGFKYAAILAKEFYHIYKVNGRTKIKNLSPIDVFYHKSPTVKWISEGQYAGFRWFLTPSSVIDMFYDDLTVQDIKNIEGLVNPNARTKHTKTNTTGIGSIAYDTQTFTDFAGNYNDNAWGSSQLDSMISDYQRYGNSSAYVNNYGLIKVTRAYWKSYKAVGWLTSYNENDEEVLEMVDENYTPDVSKGETIDWTPCNQIYTGAKIGNDMYKDIKPYTDQIIDYDDLGYCPLPVEGCTFNDTSSKPYSLVDLMIPWNELYNIVAHELREDMNSSLGRVLFMSVDHIPNIPGFDMKKWYFWAKKFKIAWVKQPKGSPNTFNQFSSADMSFAQQMVAKMDALQRIQANCDAIAGFSPNRVAASSDASTLGEASQNLVASVNQTEYIFFRHSKLIERVLNQAMNLARKDLKSNTFVRNLFDDYELAYIDYDPEAITGAKLGIYVTNSGDDQRKRMALDQLMQPAMQNGADFGDLAEVILSETISEVKNIATKLRRQARDARQAEQQMKQQELQAKTDFETRKQDDFMTIEREKLATERETAYMKTFMMQKDNLRDTNGNDTPDVLEWNEFSAKQQDMLRKHGLAQGKQLFDQQKHYDDMTLAEKKLRMEEKQMKNDKEIAEVNARNRNKGSSSK